MIEWIIWGVSFLSLYIGIFWLHVVLLKEDEKQELKELPFVSIIVPCWNVEKGLWKTLHSIANLDYPLEKLEIIIVNHGSKDNTENVAKKFIESHNLNIKLVKKEREKDHMKAHAFNEGLKYALHKYVACIDADTIVTKESLKNSMKYFDSDDIGAVISCIKVSQPRNIYEKVQHLEYIFSTFTRRLMSKIDTLQTTHGALTVYKKSFFDKYGGFDEKNITEDFEVAMRMRYQGYRVVLATDSFTYTYVPNTFNWFWRQRVRWFRGFLYNNMKYKGMMFKKKYGLLGKFQYPLNMISIGVIIMMFGLMSYTFIDNVRIFFIKLSSIGMEYFKFYEWSIPTIKQIIYSLNITVLFPIIISFIIGLLIYHLAHKNLKEKWRFPFALVCYLTIYPLIRSFQWMNAFYEEVFKARKKW